MSTAAAGPGHGERPEGGFRRGGRACVRATLPGPGRISRGLSPLFLGAERCQ